jgi:hypothetical protein
MSRATMPLSALTLAVVAVVAAVAVPAPALAQAETPRNTYCQGPYALCIKAPCKLSPAPPIEGGSDIIVNSAMCSCDVVDGWSMGPASCDARQKRTVQGHTYLMSTYSNLYNDKHQTLFCKSEDTVWAWCYGAPCLVDEEDPTKAICNCPIKVSPAMTLGGGCQQDACKKTWSAASPAQDTFANNNFYNYMKANHPDWPTNLPATACDAGAKPATGGR